ncbi:hypothetical protein Moror_5198 [Moniliophthora roreri MCA 2997]|uniref:DUF6535 domain-containing protein n=2 Tax=Moniliophthora roreri TaxID=221103 RepID=V2X8T5_MONRO|nr:hypothetical protein Moror_5198 [Moniliophthora roreri MCA 2997]KAI3610046.1 hypothetical protein WG66_007386 [Moniliophthora roreri]
MDCLPALAARTFSSLLPSSLVAVPTAGRAMFSEDAADENQRSGNKAAKTWSEAERKTKQPTVDESWEKMMKEVNRYDEDMVKNWKEDIDTLLVFAGLFSAVVTAFCIESYQWLSEDPANTTVVLLQQISQQLNHPNMTSATSPQPDFHAESSSVRINCYWFLSLVLSLTSGLFALLCKQWLREHIRDTPTRTPSEALALSYMRSESLRRWGVPSFLSALPILLEVALLLFFAGVLDLLLSLHNVPFILVSVVIGISAGLYFLTALLPTLAIQPKGFFHAPDWGDISPPGWICPYKSPQAWAVYSLVCSVMKPVLRFPAFVNVFKKWGWLYPLKYPASDWSAFDLEVIRRYDVNPFLFPIDQPVNLRAYEILGLSWAVAMFRDSPSFLPHLRNVLQTWGPRVVLPTIFESRYWVWTMWDEVEPKDVDTLLLDEPWERREGLGEYYNLSRKPAYPKDEILRSGAGIQLLYHQECWVALSKSESTADPVELLQHSIHHFKKMGIREALGISFYIPFTALGRLWTHQNPDVRMKSMRLLSELEAAWKEYAGPEEEVDERLAFLAALARHINRQESTSGLLIRQEGQTFLRFINDQIILHRLYQPWSSFDMQNRRLLMDEWDRAMHRAQKVGRLPSGYFVRVPEAMSVEQARVSATILDTIDSASVHGDELPSPASPSVYN